MNYSSSTDGEKQVFYSNDINQKWDGTFESTDAQNGTYNFKVLVKKYFDDIIYQEYGVVTLLEIIIRYLY